VPSAPIRAIGAIDAIPRSLGHLWHPWAPRALGPGTTGPTRNSSSIAESGVCDTGGSNWNLLIKSRESVRICPAKESSEAAGMATFSNVSSANWGWCEFMRCDHSQLSPSFANQPRVPYITRELGAQSTFRRSRCADTQSGDRVTPQTLVHCDWRRSAATVLPTGGVIWRMLR
jgi:hypothetical protein